MGDLVKEFMRRNNNDAETMAAWALGYINRLENQIDNSRKALGAEPMEMKLIDNLKDYIENQDT